MADKNEGRTEKTTGGAMNKILKIAGTVLLFVITAALLFSLFVAAAVGVIMRGPSAEAQRIFTLSCNETSALKFIPYWFLPDEKVNAILNRQEVTEEVSDFAELPFEDGTLVPEASGTAVETAATETEAIQIVDIVGGTYRGKLMIVADPSRVVVGTLEHYGEQYSGEYLYEFIERYGAVGGTNAGGFYDPEGFGTGGIPDGIVMKDGEIVYGSKGSTYRNFMGFDADGILHVGTMSGSQALELGIISGVSFNPGKTLVIDGQRQLNLGGGVNPRTALGQREDGAVLLLVIEGRHPGSLGATYDDLAEVMVQYGAVNAGMLDGGSSSIMFYEGEQITRGSNIIGMRRLATSILVMPEEGRE